MSKLISLFTIPTAIILTLDYFKILNASELINFDIALIGAIMLVAVQIISYFKVSITSKGTTTMGKIIPTLLAIPGIVYLVNMFLIQIPLPIDLRIIISAFLFTEGLYALH